MTCYCTCGWPVHTDITISLDCPQCGKRIECIAGNPPQPPPPEQWPYWALAIKRLRTDGEKGVGSTVKRLAAWIGGEHFKRLASRLGMPCGCSEREAQWNQEYPYPPPPD